MSSPANEATAEATAEAMAADFGPNEWLVHEIWQQYQTDPASVSAEWREFLSDYSPEPVGTTPPALTSTNRSRTSTT